MRRQTGPETRTVPLCTMIAACSFSFRLDQILAGPASVWFPTLRKAGIDSLESKFTPECPLLPV